MRLHYFNNRPTSRNASASRQYEATDLFRCFRLAGQSASLTAEPDLRLKTCTVFVEVFVALIFSSFAHHVTKACWFTKNRVTERCVD